MLQKTDSPLARLFLLYQARDWGAARRLLSDDAIMLWHSSGECFSGGDAIIHVNAVYPEGWRITLLEDNLLTDGRRHVIAAVDHHEQRFLVNSFATLTQNDLIVRLDEYWATCEEPQRWRVVLPGWSRLMG
ncbi:hypothetical protein [uncultured Aquitalea sp.]|uniref:hypothetical protein n=1 Tax=uncultured Aquitalea sp. TaxID=540272 RepID=UPI0025E46A67|nr:hypothetical protein [uncultured Aquitalea sp.]